MTAREDYPHLVRFMRGAVAGSREGDNAVDALNEIDRLRAELRVLRAWQAYVEVRDTLPGPLEFDFVNGTVTQDGQPVVGSIALPPGTPVPASREARP